MDSNTGPSDTLPGRNSYSQILDTTTTGSLSSHPRIRRLSAEGSASEVSVPLLHMPCESYEEDQAASSDAITSTTPPTVVSIITSSSSSMAPQAEASDKALVSFFCPSSPSSSSSPTTPTPLSEDFSPASLSASSLSPSYKTPFSPKTTSLLCSATTVFESSLRLQEDPAKTSCCTPVSGSSTSTSAAATATADPSSATPTTVVSNEQMDNPPTSIPTQASTATAATPPSHLLDLPTEILEEIACRLVAPRNFVRCCRRIYDLSLSPSLRAKYLWLLHGPDQVLTRKMVELHKLTSSILSSPVALLLIAMGASYRDPEEFIFRWACSKGHVDVVRQLLLRSEPRIDLRFRSDWFLREAAKNGRQGVVSMLLQEPDYIPSESGLNKAFEAAYELSHCSTAKALLDFAEARGAAVQQLELDQKAGAALGGSAPPTSFLSVVPSTRRAKRVMAGGLFIQKDADKALRYAVRGNDVEMVKLLMDYEADVHAFNEEAILVAAHKGHVEILKLLIQAGADIETKAGAPLRQAAEGGHVDAVKVLCESGADTMWGGCSALRTAASQGFDQIIATLLDHGANVNIHEGTPLQLACQHGHEAAVRVLLRYGANHRLDDGAAYKLALEANHEGIKALLIQAETTMRAKERELDRISQQQQPSSAWYPSHSYPTFSLANPSPYGSASSAMSSISRGHKRFYSQMSNPLSVADLFRSGSVCGLVALDDEIRSRQRSESNRL